MVSSLVTVRTYLNQLHPSSEMGLCLLCPSSKFPAPSFKGSWKSQIQHLLGGQRQPA